MIGHLSGRILVKRPPYLLLDVGGIGYEIEATMTTFSRLADEGGDCSLYIHLVVRDDAHVLFGFADWDERALFRELIRVNGVGPRLALTILSGMDADAFAACLQAEDIAALTRLPGVGRKTAQRLVVEMRDRLSAPMPGAAVTAPARAGKDDGGGRGDPLADALSGLVALGYKIPEARRLLDRVDGQGLSSADLIRRALQAGLR